ncbi:MAG TPA: PIN domain-containing protein [Candidatus Binatia bacterium]|nr:PIN domain-containing protein [Candidatus Binatia bacterium]
MIVVDTSVWVAALRSASGVESEELRRLLDHDDVALVVVVKLEILAGARARDRRRLRRLLSALPIYVPEAGTWERIESWIEDAAASGERFGIGDLIVAGVAADHGAPVWSLDSDFARMARLGLIDLHRSG